MGINAADLIVVAVILLSGLWAFWRGFVREVLGIAGWVGAAFATLYGFPIARPYARQLITIEPVADVVAGLVLFIAALVLTSLIAGAISSTVRGSGLGALDRSLGFLFGLLRGFVLVCLGFLALTWAIPRSDERPAWVAQARSLPVVERGAAMLMALVPNEARERGREAGELAKREAQRTAEDAARRAAEQLMAPPGRSDAKNDNSGYNDGERRQLDRLFQGKQ